MATHINEQYKTERTVNSSLIKAKVYDEQDLLNYVSARDELLAQGCELTEFTEGGFIVGIATFETFRYTGDQRGEDQPTGPVSQGHGLPFETVSDLGPAGE